MAEKTIDLRLRNEELLAIGKFNEGVVLYFQDGEEQDEIVFNMRKDHYAKDNLYWTLKGFIGLYAQGVH